MSEDTQWSSVKSVNSKEQARDNVPRRCSRIRNRWNMLGKRERERLVFFVVPTACFMGCSMMVEGYRGSGLGDWGEYIEFPKSALGFKRMIRGLLMPNELASLERVQATPPAVSRITKTPLFLRFCWRFCWPNTKVRVAVPKNGPPACFDKRL